MIYFLNKNIILGMTKINKEMRNKVLCIKVESSSANTDKVRAF
jgi:hypothetical protein